LSSKKIEKILITENIHSVSDKYDSKTYKEKLVFIPLFFLSFFSFFRVIFFYLKQFFIHVNNKNKLTTLIINTGRGYELDNLKKIFEVKVDEMHSIYAYDITCSMKHQRVELFPLMVNFLISIRDYNRVLVSRVPINIKIEALKCGIRNIPMYVYLKTFFKKLKEINPNCVVYTSGAMLSSHASISSNIKTVNLYHGLMPKISLDVLPKYDAIYVYSHDERKYLISAGVDSKICVYHSEKVKSKMKTIIIFMPDSISFVNKSSLLSLIKLFNSFHYMIYIKAHPLSNSPRQLIEEYNIEEYNLKNTIDSSAVKFILNGDGSSIIEKEKPSFVVGWDSTVLCESLNMDIIPINFKSPRHDEVFEVYSPRKKSLIWPNSKKIIHGLLLNNISYADVIEEIRSN
jgi:hypothetical protein